MFVDTAQACITGQGVVQVKTILNERKDNMKVCLGIDPGLSNTGWAIVSRKRHGAFEIMDCGCIRTSKKESEPTRIHKIYNDIRDVLHTYQLDLLAVERVFFNQNPISCLSTAGVSYMCQLAAEQEGMPSMTFTPQQVKMACGCGHRASKRNVKVFVSKLTKTTITNTHVADATACAIAGLLKMRTYKEK